MSRSITDLVSRPQVRSEVLTSLEQYRLAEWVDQMVRKTYWIT